MSDNVIQTSFAAGELAPSIAARTDLSKYHSGAAFMRNFFVDYRSGASTRAGTKFVMEVKNPSQESRLIPFQFSTDVSYILQFGNLYIRFISEGAVVIDTSFSITNISNGNPGLATAPGNVFVSGDWIYISGVAGMTQINNRYFEILSAGDPFILADVHGTPVDTLNYDAYISGGSAQRVYTLASPFSAADLDGLKFVQSASVMTITHPNYPPYNLSSVGPTSWAIAPIVFGTTITAPAAPSIATSAAGAVNYAFKVTAIDDEGQESVPSSQGNIAAAVNLRTTAGTLTVTWAAVAGAVAYNVYKAELSLAGAIPAGSAFGYVGTVTGTTFIDSNINPNYAVSPPIPGNPFLGNNPIAVSYFQQRLCFGGSDLYPTTFWMSQPGSFYNFDISDPIQDDDAITGTIVSREVNAIKSLLPMPGGLIALTSKGAWQIAGAGGGAATTNVVTPSNVIAIPQAYNGASDLAPIVVNYDIVYVQAKGSTVRDLSYNIYANIYTGTDVSVLSNHLFLGFQITEWTYAEEPYKIIWAIRNDGTILTLTFVKEQEIYGWAHSDTFGLFKSVASVTEGEVDAVYVIVARTLNGVSTQTIERFDNRMFTYSNGNPENLPTLPSPYLTANADSAWCVDCGLQSPLTTYAAHLTANTNVGAVLFSINAGLFTGVEVGSILRMGGGIAEITSFVDPTHLNGTWLASPSVTVPNDPNNTPLRADPGDWSLTAKFTTFYGLDHLEGETVSILADGGVVSPQVVTNGSIVLQSPASLVTVGLPYRAQLQSMYLDVSGGSETIQGKRKHVSAVTARVAATRGLQIGRTFATLVPIKELSPNTVLGSPTPLITYDERVVLDPLWDVPGQVCIQQDNPLPATVLGLIPEITLGDK